MVVPDSTQIAEILLFAEGFDNCKVLALTHKNLAPVAGFSDYSQLMVNLPKPPLLEKQSKYGNKLPKAIYCLFDSQ